MSLRFAASRTGNDAILARILGPVGPRRAANDNGQPIGDMMNENSILRSALLHFARHGLGAVDAARAAAEQARAAGDEPQFRHWLAICRQLDRRLARRIEGRTGVTG